MKKIIFIGLLLIAPIFAHADATSTATITIRDRDTTAFNGIVDIAASTTPPVDIAPSGSTSTISVAADSLLATLEVLDATTSDFDITDLAYFPSFDSFIINCIAISSASTTDCFNWTYAVNGDFPQVGADHQILENGDVVYLFFGPPRQTVLSTTTVAAGEPFTATAQSYDLAAGTYVGAPGLTLGVGTPNPDFSFTELATSTADENGQAIFTLNATGTFAVGIQEDFYFPSVSITITDIPTTTAQTEEPPPAPSGGGGGGGGGIAHTQLNVPNALAYLSSQQNADGSFADDRLSDWAALAFAAFDPGAAKTKLRTYLLGASPALVSTRDYERHVMGLESLGIDPYSGTSINYVTPILAAFDGDRIGSDVRDDIFALFPLLHAGHSPSDDIIQKSTAYIISQQGASGSWGDPDTTAGAIQALGLVNSLPNASAAIAKAEQYLHSQQQSNGGFGNSFSTSWVLQAIAALNELPSNWAPSGYNPNDYLASLQQSDGGMEPSSADTQTRVWATEYAIPASIGRTWDSLLSSFPKPAGGTGAGGEVLGVATSSTTQNATTTLLIATSTATEATSTVQTAPGATTTTEINASNIGLNKTLTSPKPSATKKKTLNPPAPVAPPAQAQAAAAESGGNFLANLWHAILSFFARLF